MSTSKNKRAISAPFMLALLEGVLNPILKRVQTDETLLLALRGDYINIYYRGGNLIKITEKESGFSGSFDLNYVGSGNDSLRKEIEQLPKINLDSDVMVWIDAIPKLKLAIDIFLGSGKDKHEREFQQLVARENNSSGISNETEYFIADIEYANSELGARFDLLAIQWLADQRRDGSNCRLALVEMKYGDKALGGSSGLNKHLEDIQKFLNGSDAYNSLLEEVASVFEQLRKLGLIRFSKSGNNNAVKLDRNEKPEIIFLLANHNPRSDTQLSQFLASPLLKNIVDQDAADFRFFVASFAGYGMHGDCMFTLEKFKEFHQMLTRKD